MIRIAAEGDVPAMLEIYRPYVLGSTATFEYDCPTEAEFMNRFRSCTARFPWLVWEEDGKVLGYAYASAPFSRAAYQWCAEPTIYLRPQAQGRGIGRKLYTALEAILARQGYQVLYALVTEENTASLAFHHALGYRPVGHFPDCGFKFGRWLGLVWLEKRSIPVEIPNNAPIPWKIFQHSAEFHPDILGILSLS